MMFENWNWNSIIENFVKIVGSLVGGGFIWKFIERRHAKKKESLELANAYKSGEVLEIQIKTNIDKIVEEKTKALNAEIIDLKGTIVNISTKYTSDLDRYITRMSDLERKFDSQIDRNKEIEDRLFAEIKIREECMKELELIINRVRKIETKTDEMKVKTEEIRVQTEEVKVQTQEIKDNLSK